MVWRMICVFKRHRYAFTLIEMIGVLAVMAVIVSLLIPKIYEAISNAHVGQALLSCQTIKTATLEHYGKFLTLASSNGTPLTVPAGGYANFDLVLLAEGLIDKPFAPKMGASALIRLRDVSGTAYTQTASVDPKDSLSTYDLDGDGNNDIVGAQYVVEALISDVTDADAKALNDTLDGPQLGELGTSGQDFKGRVTYHKTTGSNPLVVHIYITHR